MELANVILKNLLLPVLEKDTQFAVRKITDVFLDSFVTGLCDFEKDAKSVYALLYNLELKDPEIIITKLEVIYTAFIKELAENYVIGHSSEIHKKLFESNNTTFEKDVNFFKNLEKAIKKIERKRISDELPTSYDKLTFELDETVITNTIKKISREDLKKKMMKWDNELEVKSSFVGVKYSLADDGKKLSENELNEIWEELIGEARINLDELNAPVLRKKRNISTLLIIFLIVILIAMLIVYFWYKYSS